MRVLTKRRAPLSVGVGSIPLERMAAVLLLAMYVLWVLSLPAWPSQDGPVHLYLTEVLGQLLTHRQGPAGQYFAVKHLLPPYALYYYLLMALGRVVPLLVADKLVVCLYMVLFLSGFHALARAVAPGSRHGADRAALLATVVLLNWPLGMGFVNYCLSLALALWAMAVWFGDAGRGHGRRRRVVFLGLVVLITLAHPVPLLLVLGICGLDLAMRRLELRAQGSLRVDALTFGVALLPLLYVRAFAARHLLAQRSAELPLRARLVARFAGYLQGRSVGFVFGHTLGVEVYRVGLSLVLALPLLVAGLRFAGSVRRRRYGRGDLFFVAAVFLFAVLPWLPSDISGAYFFPERLLLLIWVFGLLACAGWEPARASRVTTWGCVVFAGVVGVNLLVSADAALRPRAVQARVLERTPLFQVGERVLVLESERLPPPRRVTPSWNPEYWMAVHAVRADGAALANAPWLDSAIIPLGAKADLPAARLTPELANSPQLLGAELRKDPALGAGLLGSVDAVVLERADAQPVREVDRALMGHGVWSCAKAGEGTVQVCRRGR